MTRWMRHRTLLSAPPALLPARRCYTHAASPRRIPVRCGMSGSINVDLYNIDNTPSTTPLLIYLPPFSTSATPEPLPLPAFCRDLPTAVVNYRWKGYSPWEADHEAPRSPTPLADAQPSEVFSAEHQRWPAPIHDTLIAYSWLIKHLEPPAYMRRSVYVYGSYLGASLAASLALTENHPHHRMAVRGCVAFNGVYNWTMFLPNHPMHQQAATGTTGNVLEQFLTPPEDPELQELGDNIEALFTKPEKVFDHFASPCLFFHTPGLLVPPSFADVDNASISRAVYFATLPSPSPSSSPEPRDAAADATEHAAREEMAAQMAALKPLTAPRRSPLMFPPRASTLRIPETLLLHTTPPSPAYLQRRGGRLRKKGPAANSFAHHASELAGLMHKSINRLELKERGKWDEEQDGFDDEAAQRVQVRDVGLNTDFFELPEQGQQAIRTWLEDRMGQHA
ncbi:hypothetical protein Micbo1qcDRAFT_237042 [Microdochium bolleyi]|uniref:Alpha/Beta hydrolase protein n=1 Tax=Microdochium bolleyi TaxID=196109 RepID=A0A136IN22_9PEZI|nr:hypothetical protein Micbo1qcDRAFT_237042 [Microdochium bolleyi]